MSHEPALSAYEREFVDEELSSSSSFAMTSSTRKQMKVGLIVLCALVLMASIFTFSSGKTPHAPAKAMKMEKAGVIADTRCPAGTYFSARKCHACPAGHFCVNNGKRQCPPGKYQSAPGKSSCVAARCGRYVAAPGATSEQLCRSGTYAPRAGSSRCATVPKGHWSGAGSCGAHKCAKGWYQDCQGQKVCRRAPCGHYVSGVGWARYLACPVGTYQASAGLSSCAVTGPGTYSRVGYCHGRKCPPGSFQPRSRQGGCILSGCGHYVSSSGARAQVKCPARQYQPERGQPSCLNIPNGFVATGNRCGITRCPRGTYRSGSAPYKCLAVPCGHYTNSAGSMRPKKCRAGWYQNKRGQAACKPAPVGHYPTSNQCGLHPCKPGTHQNQRGQTGCKPTICGQVAPRPGMAHGTNCAPGSYQNRRGQTSCMPCSTGQYQNKHGQCKCVACPVGWYQGRRGQRGCSACPCGQFAGRTGSVSCKKCPSGEYQNRGGQSRCIKAPPGRYSKGGACNGTPCKAGTFSATAGMSSCTEAKCGHYVSSAAQTRATPCPAGWYQPLAGQTRCLAAPKGSYTNGRGKCKETLCGIGQYQPRRGRTSCLATSCGHYVAIRGAEAQNPCGAGRWQDKRGQRSCKTASLGHFVSGFGKCAQSACGRGYYSDCQGQDRCIPAPCGNYVSGVGRKNYTPCPAGTYQNTPGQRSCKSTPRGRFSRAGWCYPNLCDPGTYQHQAGKSSCISAKCGHYVDYEGAVGPRRCPAATYQPKTGQTGCLPTSVKSAPSPGTCNKVSASGACSRGSGVVYVNGKVVGCNGAFSGGMWGGQAKSLCRAGWHICSGIAEVRKLGLSSGTCLNRSPLKTFYATQQRSTGNGLCNNRGANDVWGCGRGLPFLAKAHSGCTPFPYFTGSWGRFGGTKWSCPNCNSKTYHEAQYIQKSAGEGGVLCCRGGGARKFYLSRGAGTYATKKAACAATGGELASIHNAADNAAVVAVCPRGRTCWIGGKWVGGKWVWQDGTPVKYFNWNRGEPNGRGREGCIQFYAIAGGANGKWNDLGCHGRMEAVCEKRVTSPSTSVSGGWTLVARQTVSSGFFPRSVVSTGKLNAHNPRAGNYMNLGLIEKHRRNGAFEFKLVWPKSSRFSKPQIWKQTSNPWLPSQRRVRGYRAVSVPYAVHLWGGIEWNGHSCVLDGSVNSGAWWFAVGSFSSFGGGMPGPNAVVKQVELYVR